MIRTGLGQVILVVLLVAFGAMTLLQWSGGAPLQQLLLPLALYLVALALIASIRVDVQLGEPGKPGQQGATEPSETAGRLAVRLFPFPGRRIAYEDIQNVEVVQYRPIRDYGGWGLRWSRTGTAYTVSGNIGVRVELRNGKHVLIGTTTPAALREAIRGKIHG